jgi:hypothetical protein
MYDVWPPDDQTRPSYWEDPDYDIPDESDLNPLTLREKIRRQQREQEGQEKQRGNL